MASGKKKIGLLPFFEFNQNQDWQLEGYYNNFKVAAQNVPRDKLVSFFTPAVSGTKTAPTEIVIRKLLLKGSTKTVVSSTTYSVTMYSKSVEDATQTEYYFIQSALSGDYLDEGCYYEILVEDADGNKFISNIFRAINEADLSLLLESGGVFELEDGQSLVL